MLFILLRSKIIEFFTFMIDLRFIFPKRSVTYVINYINKLVIFRYDLFATRV